MNIIDFHTHAFPDAIAERAIPQLETCGIKARLDGKISSLLASMDAHDIQRAVVCSIATRPEQFSPILQWSRRIASERLVPFPSVHPEDPEAARHVREIKEAGLRGIKLHPYYQQFAFDEQRLFPIYEAAQDCGLILLGHAGFDLAFPRDRIADPARIRRVTEAFPRLKFVAAHMGAWEDWDEVRRHLLGRPVYMDVSFFLGYIDTEQALEFLSVHPRDYILFGTDSPWADLGESVEEIRALGLAPELEERIFFRNAETLLASANGN